MCPLLDPPDEGSVRYSSNSETTFTIGTIATYSCTAGFVLVGGDTVRSCMDDDQTDTVGVWNGTAPFCVGKCRIVVCDND